MSLEIEAFHRLGGFTLDARFEAGQGLVALFGRSGSGKTSLVNVVAGLLRPERGAVVVEGVRLLDTKAGVFVPRHQRRIGYVFQDGRLFPHLSVRQNLNYGRWFTPRAERREDISRLVELLGLGSLLDRQPSKLSGGEKQRVAIGRALLADPRLLLMDEPLASLDEERKAEIMPFIERLRDESQIPIVYVSHSVPEVARLATTIVLMSDGRVMAAGPAGEMLQRIGLLPDAEPGEVGVLIEAAVEAHDEGLETTLVRSRAGLWSVPRLGLPKGARVRVRVLARDVMLATSRPENLSALNIIPGVVSEVIERGGALDVRVDCNGETLLAGLTRQSVQRLDLRPGSQVFAVVKALAFDRRTLGAPLAPPRAEGDEALFIKQQVCHPGQRA